MDMVKCSNRKESQTNEQKKNKSSTIYIASSGTHKKIRIQQVNLFDEKCSNQQQSAAINMPQCDLLANFNMASPSAARTAEVRVKTDKTPGQQQQQKKSKKEKITEHLNGICEWLLVDDVFAIVKPLIAATKP